MRKFVAIGAVALLMLAVAVPFATAGTATAPKAVAGNFIGTYTGPGADGNFRVLFRFEVRTDASGAVQFGYYQTEPLGHPELRTVATVDAVRFFRDASGAKAAQLGGTECNVVSGECNGDYNVVVTDGALDTFCGGNPCLFTYSVDDGNIAIYTTGGQNLQQ